MLQNQNPVRRWKQWLVLPALGGLFFLGSRAALAQGGPVPNQTQLKASKDDIGRKVRAAMHQDSMRTGGKFEPGTTQQVTVTNASGKSGEVSVAITRVPEPPRQVAGSRYTEPRSVAPSGSEVYTYVEQMPALQGGGGQQAIVQAIQSKIVYPKATPGETVPDGRVFANFVVDSDGTVQNAGIIKGLSPALDQAVLAAIKQLPRFEPGKQGGQAVAVSFTVPVEFRAKP